MDSICSSFTSPALLGWTVVSAQPGFSCPLLLLVGRPVPSVVNRSTQWSAAAQIALHAFTTRYIVQEADSTLLKTDWEAVMQLSFVHVT